jgi:hypothetical protein
MHNLAFLETQIQWCSSWSRTMSILTTLQSDAALVEVLATVPRRRRVRPALEGIERSGRMPA